MQEAVRKIDETFELRLFKAKEMASSEKVVNIGDTSAITEAKPKRMLYNIYKKVYKVYRYAFFPFSWGFVLLWWWLLGDMGKILHAQGIHYITATTGGGKSLLAFHIVEEKREFLKKNSYINSPFEKAIDGVKHHKVFDFSDFWDDNGVMIKRPNGRKYATIVFDEVHRLFNPRLNKMKEYNIKFAPFMDWLTIHRHEKFENVYLLSQLKLDVQMSTIVKFIHQVNVKKRPSLGIWLKTGERVLLPKKFYIETWTQTVKDEYILVKTHKKAVRLDLLDRFETHALASVYDSIPLDGAKGVK